MTPPPPLYSRLLTLNPPLRATCYNCVRVISQELDGFLPPVFVYLENHSVSNDIASSVQIQRHPPPPPQVYIHSP